MENNKLHFILTGGTIDSHYDGSKDTAVPNEHSVVPRFIKSLKLYETCEFTEICMKDSREINELDRKKILETISNSNSNRIVITHGTYTLPDTARYLKANIIDNNKTIILIASMIPLEGFTETDAGFNLGYAVAKSQELKQGIHICMNGRIFTPEEVIKIIQAAKLPLVVAINKIDKEGSRPKFALDATLELFLELGAGDHSLDFPVIYASGRAGKAGLNPDLDKMTDITPIFDAILQHIPSPIADKEKPLQILVTSIVADNFKGRIAIGRVYNGVIKAGQEIIQRDGQSHGNRDHRHRNHRIHHILGICTHWTGKVRKRMIFTVRTTVGQESLVVDILAGKIKGEDLNLYSFAVLPGLKGYILVEADNEMTVRRGIANTPHVKGKASLAAQSKSMN